MTAPPGDPGRRATATISAAAFLGFVLLAFVFPAWTYNVESAQVVAGVVRLPADNPMRLYHLSVVSLLIDPAALLLRLGLSEWTLSVLSSGLQGAVVFAGLAAATLAFSGSAPVSLLVPVMLLAFQVRPGAPPPAYPYLASLHGHGYPILLANHPYIYGTVGLFAVLLAWGLAALRKDRAAALLAGLLPWIHPSMAIAGWIGLAAAVAAGRVGYPPSDRMRLFRWFATGCLLSLLGAGAHRVLASPSPVATDPALAARIAAHFLENWDTHRVLPPGSIPAMLEVDAWLLATFGVLLAFRRRALSDGGRFLVRCLLAATAPGVLWLLWLLVSPGTAPDALRPLMIHRWLNLNSAAFPAIVFGVLARFAIGGRNPFALAALSVNALLVLTLAVDSLTVSSRQAAFPGEGIPGALRGLLFPVLGCVASWAIAATDGRVERKGWRIPAGFAARAGSAAAVLLVAAFLALRIAPLYRGERLAGNDRFTPLMENLSRREGLVLLAVPTMQQVSLRTRRGVLLDPAQIDFLGYVPEAGPRMEQILNRVYGSTLLRKREAREDPGEIANHLVPRHWPDLSPREWQALGAEYGVTSVVMPGRVPLRLPLLEGSGPVLSAYAIPPPGEIIRDAAGTE